MNLNTISFLPCLVGKANKSMTQIYTGNLNCELNVRFSCGTGHGGTSYHLLHGTGAHPTRLTTLKRGMPLLGPVYCILLPHLVSYLQIPWCLWFFQKNWPLYNRTLEIFSLWIFFFSSLNFVTSGQGEFSAVRFGWTNRYQPTSCTPYDPFHCRSSTVHVLDASIFYYPLTPRRDCF
jgi:hypothetical protein